MKQQQQQQHTSPELDLSPYDIVLASGTSFRSHEASVVDLQVWSFVLGSRWSVLVVFGCICMRFDGACGRHLPRFKICGSPVFVQ
jgi:hypothetical protein